MSVALPPEGASDDSGLLRDAPGDIDQEVANPFPGLRAFAESEASIFFGREGQADALVARMEETRFIAVVGTSGSGKSSLVRAGLLPFLRGGYLDGAAQRWSVMDLRPGFDPLGSLVAELRRLPDVFGDLSKDDLLSNSLGLVERLRAHWADDSGSLLILVDQFEELFRYGEWTPGTAREGHIAFVRALLELAQAPGLNVFVIVTMRSDFIGDCARVRGLAEAVSDGQYLIPRLTREGWKAAIEGPVRFAKERITNRLVQRLLNDTGDDPDQLPVLQHALMRTWEQWKRAKETGYEGPIDEPHYSDTGTLTHALSSHATNTYDLATTRRTTTWGEPLALDASSSRRCIKLIFQRLRVQDDKGRETRRPCTIRELQDVAEAPLADIVSYLGCFTEPGRTFLVTSRPLPQDRGSFARTDDVLTIAVDLTHECLLRRWDLLVQWCQEERESQRIYIRLLQAMEEAKNGPPIADQLLQRTLTWWEDRKPTAAWSARYDKQVGGSDLSLFARASAFLRESAAAREERSRKNRLDQLDRIRAQVERELTAKRLRRTRGALIFALLLLVSAAGGIARSVTLAGRLRAEQNKSEAATRVSVHNWHGMLREALITRADERSADPTTIDEGLMLAVSSLKVEQSVRGLSRVADLISLYPSAPSTISPHSTPPPLLVAARAAPVVVALDGRQAIFRDSVLQKTLVSVAREGTPVAIDLDRVGRRLAVLTADDRATVYDRSMNMVIHSFHCKEPQWISIDGGGHKVLATCGFRPVLWTDESGSWKLTPIPQPERRHAAPSWHVAGCELDDAGMEFSYLDTTEDPASAEDFQTYVVRRLQDGKAVESIAGIGVKSQKVIPDPSGNTDYVYRWETSRLDLRTLAAAARDGTRVDVYVAGDAERLGSSVAARRRAGPSGKREPTFSIAHSGLVRSIDISADGRVLFTSDTSGLIRGTRLIDGHEVFRTLREPFGEDDSLAISNDQRRIWLANSSGLSIMVPDDSLPMSALRGFLLPDGRHLYEPRADTYVAESGLVSARSIVSLADWRRSAFAERCGMLVGLDVSRDRVVAECLSNELTPTFDVFQSGTLTTTRTVETLHYFKDVWAIAPGGKYLAAWYSARGDGSTRPGVSRDKAASCLRLDTIGSKDSGWEDCSYPAGKRIGAFEPDGGAFWFFAGDSESVIHKIPLSDNMQANRSSPRISMEEVPDTLTAAAGGRYLLIGLKKGTPKAKLLELSATAIVRKIPVEMGGNVVAAAFASDGRHFVTAGDDLTVRVWEVAGNEVKERIRFAARARYVAFSADNSRILFDDGEGFSDRRSVSRMWRTEDVMSRANSVLAETCKRIGRDVEKRVWTDAVRQDAGFSEFRPCP